MPLSLENDGLVTFAEYLKWPDDERWEIIDGVAYATSPAPNTEHQRISRRLSNLFFNQLNGKPCEPFAAPFDIRLFFEDSADDAVTNVVQPDIVVIRDPSRIDERGGVGSPDLAVEIISSSTASHDQIREKALCEKFGVRDDWVVHPIYRIVTVYELDADGKYGREQSYDENAVVETAAVPDIRIALKSVFEQA